MELLLILFIVLIIFGAGKIPQLGEGLGKAIKGFKKSIHEPDAMDVTPSPEEGAPQQASAATDSGQIQGQPTEPIATPPPPSQQPAPQSEETRQT